MKIRINRGYYYASKLFAKELEKGNMVPEIVFFEVPKLIGWWELTKNPYYLIEAQHICNIANYNTPGLLKKLFSIGEELVLNDERPPRETAKTIKVRKADFHLYSYLAHFLALDEPLKQSCRKVARLYNDTFPERTALASSIQKEHKKKFESLGISVKAVKKMHENDKKLKLRWQLIARNTEECDDSLKGKRGDGAEQISGK